MLLSTPFDKRSKGTITTEGMLDVKRPGTGIEPKYIDRLEVR